MTIHDAIKWLELQPQNVYKFIADQRGVAPKHLDKGDQLTQEELIAIYTTFPQHARVLVFRAAPQGKNFKVSTFLAGKWNGQIQRLLDKVKDKAYREHQQNLRRGSSDAFRSGPDPEVLAGVELKKQKTNQVKEEERVVAQAKKKRRRRPKGKRQPALSSSPPNVQIGTDKINFTTAPRMATIPPDQAERMS